MGEKREFAGWWLWIVMLIGISLIAFAALNSFGVLTRTFVERKVFEQSYQKQAGDELKIRTFRAQLAEIERRLVSPNLSETERNNLEAQAAGIRVQLSTMGN